jgi:hypothetical protein
VPAHRLVVWLIGTLRRRGVGTSGFANERVESPRFPIRFLDELTPVFFVAMSRQ